MQTHLENDNRVTSPELIDPDPPSSASPETVVNRSRGPPINYNIKRLSKSSMGAGRSKDSRARSREAPDPLNEDDEEPHASPKLQRPTNSEFGINSASGRKVSHVPLPSRLQSKGSGVPNGAASAHSAANSAPAINAPAKELDEKMETWEVGPGFVRNEESDSKSQLFVHSETQFLHLTDTFRRNCLFNRVFERPVVSSNCRRGIMPSRVLKGWMFKEFRFREYAPNMLGQQRKGGGGAGRQEVQRGRAGRNPQTKQGRKGSCVQQPLYRCLFADHRGCY